MEPQKPSVGRIVHYHEAPDAPPRAAIVTRVWSDTMVNLCVFSADGGLPTPITSVPYGVDNLCQWRWPPRV